MAPGPGVGSHSEMPDLRDDVLEGPSLRRGRGGQASERRWEEKRSAGLLHSVQLERANEEHKVPRGRLLPVPLPGVRGSGSEPEGRGVTGRNKNAET